jgi:sulfate/thiosulfate-binding protein
MSTKRFSKGWVLGLATALLSLAGCGEAGPAAVEIVNVSYDPTRELYQEINPVFEASYLAQTGQRVKVTQSHGGSGAQARAVIDGLKADVVTLALAGDIDAIQKRGPVKEGWQGRLEHNSSPYTSTIVLVVRRANPKNIQDWPDLTRDDVQVITPSPKTSGGARWNFLAAWGYVTLHRKEDEAAAAAFVRRLFANVPKLDSGARGSTETFLRRKQGDVLIAWENEAILTSREMPEEGLEIIYPSTSILAEPPVAVVDHNVDERGTRAVAEAYLKFLYTEEAQKIIGQSGYRPSDPQVLALFIGTFRSIPLFTIKDVAGGWDQAQQKFFADGGVFDQIYQPWGDR